MIIEEKLTPKELLERLKINWDELAKKSNELDMIKEDVKALEKEHKDLMNKLYLV